MRYIRKRRFPARYRTAKSGKKKPGKRLAFLATALLLLWEAVCEAGLSSVSKELTEEAARGYLLSCINSAVEEELADGGNSFVSVSRLESGEISLVSANTASLNSLKAGVLSRLSKSLNGKVTASVPVGSLTGVGVLNGRGPKAPVRLNLESSADVAFQTDFYSAGINQSCHRITMTVTVRAYSQSKRFETKIEESTSTVLAETVVMGDVPEIAVTGQERADAVNLP